jgi:hypothetical protein
MKNVTNVRVELPRVHMAGSDAHYNAHIEVGSRVFLAPDAQYPMLDIDGTPERLENVVRHLADALASRT